MPKVAAVVLESGVYNGKNLAKIRLNGSLPKKGEKITVKWGRARSECQNALYWLYLSFLFNDCGLKDEYSTVDELHEMLKATFLSKRIFHGGKEFLKVGSTTTLDKLAFGEYMKQIDNAMVEYHHCDTSRFWQEYQDMRP
jgi:hypothetical protein